MASTTVTLLVVSAVFLLLNIPTEIYFLGQGSKLIPTNTAQEEAIDELFYTIAGLLYYLNSSVNFLMYFVSGAKFRQAARSTVTGAWCCTPGRSQSVTTRSTAVAHVMAAAAAADDATTVAAAETSV